MKKSFDEWFVFTHGKRPTTIRPGPMLMKIRELRDALKEAETLQQRAEIWDEQERSARRAWEASKENA